MPCGIRTTTGKVKMAPSEVVRVSVVSTRDTVKSGVNLEEYGNKEKATYIDRE